MTHVFDSIEVEDFIRSSASGPWNIRASVRAVSIANVDIATLNAGDSIDGVPLATGDRVLLKNQTTGTENGIYVVAAAEGNTDRAGDLAVGDSASMIIVYSKPGGTNGGSGWFCSNAPGSDVVATDTLTFKRYGVFQDGVIPTGLTMLGDLRPPRMVMLLTRHT
jgi:hypothetical protein